MAWAYGVVRKPSIRRLEYRLRGNEHRLRRLVLQGDGRTSLTWDRPALASTLLSPMVAAIVTRLGKYMELKVSGTHILPKFAPFEILSAGLSEAPISPSSSHHRRVFLDTPIQLAASSMLNIFQSPRQLKYVYLVYLHADQFVSRFF